jgi:hypothetical protein
MSLSRSLSERNVHVKFEKSQRFKGQNLPPSIFAISRLPSELMVLNMQAVPRRKKRYLGGGIFRGG